MVYNWSFFKDMHRESGEAHGEWKRGRLCLPSVLGKDTPIKYSWSPLVCRSPADSMAVLILPALNPSLLCLPQLVNPGSQGWELMGNDSLIELPHER